MTRVVGIHRLMEQGLEDDGRLIRFGAAVGVLRTACSPSAVGASGQLAPDRGHA
ncbi:MAG TPA: hypothetical protein VGG91_13005 [Myxococcaceae bacterium]